MRTYDHTYFEENQTADRYVMNRLDDGERDAFENHFPLCDACMESLAVSTAMVRDLQNPEINAILASEQRSRQVRTSPPLSHSETPSWRRMAPTLSVAAVMMLGFLFWKIGQPESVDLPKWQALGEALSGEDVTLSELKTMRGEPAKAIIIANEHTRFAIPYLDEAVDRILVSLYKNREAKAIKLGEMYLAPSGSGDLLHVFIPKGKLKPGSYQLILTPPGVNYHFDVVEKAARQGE